MAKHIPVLLDQVVDHLQPKKGQRFLDCTLGAGGYTLALREKIGEQGVVVSLDRDRKAIDDIREVIKDKNIENITLIKGNFGQVKELIESNFGEQLSFDGIVFDLGLSTDQLDDIERGFSFQDDRPLDMAFDQQESGKTEDIVNNYTEEDLFRIIKELGEERFARQIVKEIVEIRKERPIKTTGQLKQIISSSVPQKPDQRIHPATRTFQALRIATNEELGNLREALPQAVDLLRSEGRIAVVSYHSLEDRIVKKFFKQEAKDCICPPEAWECKCGHRARLRIITKKIVAPEEEEKRNNPRSRSAKLRVAEKM